MKSLCIGFIVVFSLFMVGCMGPSTEEFSERAYSFYIENGVCEHFKSEDFCQKYLECLSKEMSERLSEKDRKILYDVMSDNDYERALERISSLELSDEGTYAMDKSYQACDD